MASQVLHNCVQMSPETELICSPTLVWQRLAPREKFAGLAYWQLGHCGPTYRWPFWDGQQTSETHWPSQNGTQRPPRNLCPAVAAAFPKVLNLAAGHGENLSGVTQRTGVQTPEARMSALFLAPVWPWVSRCSLQTADKHTSTKSVTCTLWPLPWGLLHLRRHKIFDMEKYLFAILWLIF